MKKRLVFLILSLLFVMSVVALCSCEQTSKEYSITFKADGDVVSKQTFTAITDKITAPAVPSKSGYVGTWEIYEIALRDITVNAVYTAKQYAVTLDYNGGSSASMPDTLSVTYDKAVGELPVVTKQYYQFDGWYLANDVKVTAQTIWSLDEDATLYAKFTQPSATLLEVQGATIVDKQITMTVAKDCQTVDLSDIVIVSDDSEWMLYYDATIPPFSTTVLMPIPDKVAVLQTDCNTFYVVLNNSVDDKYTLTICRPYDVEINYIAYTADDEFVYTVQVEAGKEYALTYVPDLRGYVFNGWLDDDALPVSSITPVKDVDVYADLTPNDYKCILDVNGGNELPDSQITVTFGEYFQLSVPTKDGFDFLGWYVDDEQITDAEGVSFYMWDYDEDITTVAQWEAISDKTIVFYSTQGNMLSSLTQTAIDKFQSKYPDWTIKHVKLVNYVDLAQQIASDLQKGKQPDLAYCYGQNAMQFMSTGKLVDWSQFVTNDYMQDFIPAFVEQGYARNFGGYDNYGYSAADLLIMPFIHSGDVMFYNKTMLANNYLNVPTTWDELWNQCATLKSLSTNEMLVPLSVNSASDWFITMCQQNNWGYASLNGNQQYLFNGASQQAWLNQLKGYYNQGYFVTTELNNNYNVASFFNNGLSAFAIGPSAAAAYYGDGRFEVGVAPIPGGASLMQSTSLCMFSNDRFDNDSERKQMTYKFAQELLDSEYLAEYCCATGYVPCRHSVFETPVFAEFLQGADLNTSAHLVAQAIQVVYNNVSNLFTAPKFDGADVAREQVGAAVVEVMQNNVSAEQALQTAYDNCVASSSKKQKVIYGKRAICGN